MITAGVISARRGYGDVHAFQGIVPVARGSAKAAPALLIPVIILGGILGGIFTPTEAGAIAVLYTLIIGTFYYRTLNMRKLIDAMTGTAKVTASALVIVSTAIVFSRILTYFRIPQEILELLIAVSDNRVIMALILIGFFPTHGHVHGCTGEHDYPRAIAHASCNSRDRAGYDGDSVRPVSHDQPLARPHHAAAWPPIIYHRPYSEGLIGTGFFGDHPVPVRRIGSLAADCVRAGNYNDDTSSSRTRVNTSVCRQRRNPAVNIEASTSNVACLVAR